MCVDFRVWVLKQAVGTYVSTYYQLTSRNPAVENFLGRVSPRRQTVNGGYRLLQDTNKLG